MPKTFFPSKPTYHFAIRDVASKKFVKKSDSSSYLSLSENPCCWTTRRGAQNIIDTNSRVKNLGVGAGPFEIVVFELTLKEVVAEPQKTKKQKAVARPSGQPTPSRYTNMYTERDVIEKINHFGGLQYAKWQCNPTRVCELWNDQLRFSTPYDISSVKPGASAARYFINGVDYEALWFNDSRIGVPNAVGTIDKSGWKAKK